MVSRSRSVSRFVLITLTLVALCFIANAAGMAQTLPVTTEIPKTPLMDNGAPPPCATSATAAAPQA